MNQRLLSDDVLLEIFDYLGAKSLVCNNWDRVIGSSTATMKKFTLTFKADSDDSENDRKHVNVTVRGNNFDFILKQTSLNHLKLKGYYDKIKLIFGISIYLRSTRFNKSFSRNGWRFKAFYFTFETSD
jgi:hypothetical protein